MKQKMIYIMILGVYTIVNNQKSHTLIESFILYVFSLGFARKTFPCQRIT